MNWSRVVFSILDEKGLFQNSGHRSRFSELISCYSDKPFFTPGMCKCMYLAAWDDEHFAMLLSQLTEMSFAPNPEIADMAENGQFLMEEADGPEAYIFMLSCAFVENKPFTAVLPEDLDDRTTLVIMEALKAAAVVDQVCG